jgi:hypothetical protein
VSRWRLIDQEDLGLTLTKRKVESFLIWNPEDAKGKEDEDEDSDEL